MKIDLSPEEIVYISMRLKEPLEYFRLLSGNAKCSQATRDSREFFENLYLKLNPPPGSSLNGYWDGRTKGYSEACGQWD